MARCPKCGEAQDWWKLLRFDKTLLMTCQRCGCLLAMDSQRATILIAGFATLLLLPETRLLPFDPGALWIPGVLAVYTPFYVGYLKLNVVSNGELAITPDQEAGFATYARARRRFNSIGTILLAGGFLLFFGGMSISSLEIGERVSFLGLVAMSIGFAMRALTWCPFCKKLTARNPFGHGGRCINCHRDLDIAG